MAISARPTKKIWVIVRHKVSATPAGDHRYFKLIDQLQKLFGRLRIADSASG